MVVEKQFVQESTHDRDVAELWDAINGLRQGDSLIMAELASIKSLLTERCTARLEIITDITLRIKQLEDKYHVLDKLVLKVSLITAALSSVATALAIKLLGKMLGL